MVFMAGGESVLDSNAGWLGYALNMTGVPIISEMMQITW